MVSTPAWTATRQRSSTCSAATASCRRVRACLVRSDSGQAALRDQSLSYGVDYVIRPDWLADFRFGFFRYRVFVNPNGLGTSPAKDAGIPGLNLDNYYTSGMPYFALNGTGGFSFGYALSTNNCNCPLNEQENEFQWVGNLTHTRGNDSFKF